ncbi:MAG: hypothetical protein HYX60_04070 [Legionella longbeachae]|nr:hypothetical protein [Legionella longbeachae]
MSRNIKESLRIRMKSICTAWSERLYACAAFRRCGLRHAYVQRRYNELTKSFDLNGARVVCPIGGGKPFKQLKDHNKAWDRKAREIISCELGHSRLAITKIYWGK